MWEKVFCYKWLFFREEFFKIFLVSFLIGMGGVVFIIGVCGVEEESLFIEVEGC